MGSALVTLVIQLKAKENIKMLSVQVGIPPPPRPRPKPLSAASMESILIPHGVDAKGEAQALLTLASCGGSSILKLI